MRAPIFWLKDWVEITETPDEIAEKLLLSGTKVEAIETINNEPVLVLEVTSNRPDCLSIYGIAREIALLTNKPLKHLEFPLPKPGNIRKELKINVIDSKLCPIYTSIVIDNVTVQPSPDWMVKRLESVGVRPINNIVDVSNYVMFECGIPMHTFDYDQLQGGEITIRGSKEEERVTLLDGKERILSGGSIIIEDAKRLVDLAGIMGGQNSEVSQKTKAVFLHVPIYDPVAIRRTSKYLGLRTEAVTRYEKKLDLLGTEYSLQKGVDLLIRLAHGEIASPVYHHDTVHHHPPTISLSSSDIAKTIGISIPSERVEKILTSLECSLETKKTDEEIIYTMTPPPFRRDIQIKEDVIEEIARIYGYNNLPLTLPTGDIPIHPDTFVKDIRHQVKTAMIGLGFTEVYGYTMTSQDNLEKANIDHEKALRVLHPMSLDYQYMRLSLLPGLLTMVRDNLYHEAGVALFELGVLFYPKEHDLPDQSDKLIAVTTVHTYESLKGAVEVFANKLSLPLTVTPAKNAPAYFQLSMTGKIDNIGWIGKIDPDIVEAFGINKGDVWAVEIDLAGLERVLPATISYPALAMHPPIIEDLSFAFPEKTYIGDVIAAIKSQDPTIHSVDIIDHFESSYTFRIHFVHPEKTLTSEEVAVVRNEIVKVIEERFRGKVKR